MKFRRREYKNKDYFEFLEESFYLITSRDDGSQTFIKIKNKLKGKNAEIFSTTLLFYTGERILKIKINDELRKYEDFEKINSFKKLKEDISFEFDKYLESIEKLDFLGAISEIIYWITKIEGGRQVKIHKDFLSSWYQWHVYLEKENKSKREGQKIIEKLRLIMGDKVNDLEQINNEYLAEIDRFKAGKKNIFVNIDHEIDVNSSIYNDNLYLPEKWLGKNQDFRVVEEHTKCIVIDDKTYSLRDYYNLVKDSIDENWLKSKDLLKQIVTIYLIKRCQNGDNEAFDKLFSIYKDKAESVERKYLKVRGGYINQGEVEGRSLTILTSLLKGDNPSYLFRSLGMKTENKKPIDVINKKPYSALNESYEYMFGMINNQYESLKGGLDYLEKNTKDLRNRSKKAKKLSTKEEYYDKIIAYSGDVLSKINHAPMLFALLNPLDLLKISPKYNNYLFRPAPNRNLTTWLFGDKEKAFPGMVWTSLSNLFDRRIPRSNDSFNEDEYYQDSSGLYVKRSEKQEDL